MHSDRLDVGADQAASAGAEFLDEDVIKVEPVDNGFSIITESDQTIHTRTLILAMGVSRNKLGVAGEKKLVGKGVSYCVDCDANFHKGVPAAVVGNESAAVSGALTLLFYASDVHLVAEKLEVSDTLVHQVETSDVELHLGRKVKKITGEDALDGIVLDNGEHLEVKGLFIETGAKGAVELASFLGVALDDEKFKYIVVDKQQQTNIPGVFAAGDICGPPWQIAKAVGEGCVAGLSAAKLAKKKR